MNPGRLLLLIAALMCCAGAALADLNTGLIAHYALDGNALDSSPNANHGTVVGALVATTDRLGAPNSAYEFNGVNTYITVPNSASLASPTTALTMSAWILLYGNSKVGSPFGPILMKSMDGSNGFMYRMNASTNYFGAAYNDWNLHQSALATVGLNAWHHAAITFDGSKHRFYFDGAPVDSQTLALTITTDSRPLTIGADFPGLFECWWGKIDEVRLYNRRLSAEEIAQLHDQTVGVGDGGPAGAFRIQRVFPVPARDAITIEFSLAESAPVEIAVHDVRGRRIRTVALGMKASGPHAFVWDGRTDAGEPAGAGVYFARLRTPRAEAVARVVRIE